MQVDLRIPSNKPVAEIVSFAQRCEDAGFSVWASSTLTHFLETSTS